jgi:hypothetical protein
MWSLWVLVLEPARACQCAPCTPADTRRAVVRRYASVRSATDVVTGVIDDWTAAEIGDPDFLLRPGPVRITVTLTALAAGEPTVQELTWVEPRETCSCSCAPRRIPVEEGDRTLFWQLTSGQWDFHPIGGDPRCETLESHPRRSAAARCLHAVTHAAPKW